MGHKSAETTHSINKAFGPGTATKLTVQWWFKKFCKRDESLEDKGHSGRPFEVDKDPLRGPSKLILLQLCAKSLQLCPTLCDPLDGSHQAPPSLGFSRQEYWSGLPLPSPMHKSEKLK